jgi:membrane-associated HD superfamily phosphohydrolase
MKLTKLLVAFCFVILSLNVTNAQQLSENARVTVITIGPGSNLNDSFGHSAFRVQDRQQGIDLAFNYGVFDFEAPNFYGNFVQGKLLYMLGLAKFDRFLENYRHQNRWMKEQELNLTTAEKQQFYDFLINNAQPENKDYLYDFFFDNCATKIRDVTSNILGKKVVFNTPNNFQQKSFRQLIHNYIPVNSWGSLGIDVALGSVTDKTAQPAEHMYLPDYVFTFFKEATLNNGQKLAKPAVTLLTSTRTEKKSNFLTSPILVFGILALFILYITYRDKKQQKASKWLDITLFSITGIIGVVLCLLWFATDHTATAFNYNLLWAFPLNLIVLVNFGKTPKKWLVRYLKFLIIMLCLLFLHWIIGVQLFAIGLLPLFIALLVRYAYLSKFYKTIVG